MDELARRRHMRSLRHQRKPLVPPPMDGSIDQVIEDLTVITGMTEEVLAETRALPAVPDELHVSVVQLDDAAGKALADAKREKRTTHDD